jgi:endonuclease/exonuclease/phosphatase family metal-dependent hydrolase
MQDTRRIDRMLRTLSSAIVTALLCLSAPGRGAAAVTAGGAEPLTVLSLNLAIREDVDRIAEELRAIGGDRADLLLLQEVVQPSQGPDVARQLAIRLGLGSEYRPAFNLGDERSLGLAIVSRYPLRDLHVIDLKVMSLNFRSRTRIALGAVIDTPAGPVRVYNLHLDTRINLEQRLDQLGVVAREVHGTAGPAIVGGDFNTNNNHWLFHTLPVPFIGRQGAGVQRFMEANGFRSVFALGNPTHDVLRMQLDWLFLRGLRAANASIAPVALSDHHALLASLIPAD